MKSVELAPAFLASTNSREEVTMRAAVRGANADEERDVLEEERSLLSVGTSTA